jgi:hypothetical protein
MVTNHVNIGHVPYFDGDGSNFDYWKSCMRIHLKAMGGTIWKVIDEGFVILNEANPTEADNENILANAQAINVITRALCIHEFHRVYKLETGHDMCGGSLLKLMRALQMLKVASYLFARVNLKSLHYYQMKN